MKKLVFTVIIVFALLGGLVVIASSVTPAATSVTSSLSFSGTTANCRVSIVEIGKEIDASLELWCGSTLVDSWSGSATSQLVITGTHSVVSGQTYTLKVNGTINEVAFSSAPITKTCP